MRRTNLSARRSLFRALSAFAIAFFSMSIAGAAAAEEKAPRAEVMVLHATQKDGKGEIDPQIGKLPQLKKPPFSAYNSYKLLDKVTLALKKGSPVAHALANGRRLTVKYVEKTKDGRYRVSTAIDKPGGKTYLKSFEVTAAPNEPFFVAGQSYDGGILVVGITLLP